MISLAHCRTRRCPSADRVDACNLVRIRVVQASVSGMRYENDSLSAQFKCSG